MPDNKRRAKRLELNVNIALDRIDKSGAVSVQMIPVRVLDLSKDGIGFITNRQLELDSFYNTEIEIWTKERLKTVIKIVRVQKVDANIYRYGCIFLGLSDVDRFKIDIYQMIDERDEKERREKIENGEQPS